MAESNKGTLIMIAVGAAVIALAAIIIVLGPAADFWGWVIRGAAMVGYVAAFLAIVSSVYMRELFQLLGRPFLWGHHVVSVTSLVLITLHPVAVAIDFASASVFVPTFGSWGGFFRVGGRPVALYLLLVGSLAGLLRRRLRKNWRIIHLLNYVAFALGTMHAALIGSDFGRSYLRAVPIVLGLAMAAVFVQKRVALRRAQARRRR